MESEGDGFIVEKKGPIGYLYFNRPEKLNAWRQKDYEAFEDIVNDFEADEKIRAVIMTGVGRAFTAGDDLDEMPQHLYPYLFKNDCDSAEAGKYLLNWSMNQPYHIVVKTILTILNSGKIYIAAVNGVCWQTELIYPLDFVIAADTAVFAQGDVRWGIVGAAASTQTLPRMVGRRRALEIMLTADEFSAEEAYRRGVVNKVVPLQDLMAEAEALANRVILHPYHAIKLTKMAVTKAQDLPLVQGLEIEGYFSRISHTRENYAHFANNFLKERRERRAKKAQGKG